MSSVEHILDRGLKLSQRIGPIVFGLVVEERRTGKFGDFEQRPQWMVGLEGGDSLGLYCRPCAIKSRNFFR